MRLKNVCLNCKNRAVGCHSTCEKYIEFRKEIDEICKKKVKQKQLDNDFYELRHRWFK